LQRKRRLEKLKTRSELEFGCAKRGVEGEDTAKEKRGKGTNGWRLFGSSSMRTRMMPIKDFSNMKVGLKWRGSRVRRGDWRTGVCSSHVV